MRVLSVRQPWAWLISHGHKTIENRTWSTPYRGLVLIHAGSSAAPREHWEYARRLCRQLGVVLPDREDLPRGGIVGMAELTDVVSHSDSPWWVGPVGLVLSDACPLPLSPMPGKLGLYTPSPSELSAISIS